jgi:hypothetical protein
VPEISPLLAISKNLSSLAKPALSSPHPAQ